MHVSFIKSSSSSKISIFCLLSGDVIIISFINQDLRSTAIYGAKNGHFQDIATIHSAVA